ncbi:MAG: hypothetical protein ABR505_11455 [Actinomycetota bacterium]
MRKRVVWLATISIVFAPGWADGDISSRASTGADLVGRILAPTFEEASAEPLGAAAFKERVGRSGPQTLPHNIMALLPNAALTQAPSQLLLGSVLAVVLFVWRQLSGFGAQRAPPHLLTV